MQPVLLFFLIFTSLSTAIMNKEKCPEPSPKLIEEILEELLTVAEDDIALIETHYLCLAVRALRLYDSMSIVTAYSLHGAQFLAQFDIVCADGSVWQSRPGSLNTSITIELFSIKTSSMCYQCNYDASDRRKAVIIEESITHCIRKFITCYVAPIQAASHFKYQFN